MSRTPFSQRVGNQKGKFIDRDFPARARIALGYIFVDLANKKYLTSIDEVILELNRLGRISKNVFEEEDNLTFFEIFTNRLDRLTWDEVYTFCERVYNKLLSPVENYNELLVPINEVKDYYTNEINQVLDEENLTYSFRDGIFERRGNIQTVRALETVGYVLNDNRLAKIKTHFNKAKSFFDSRPDPDLENCVKDALCALEAALEILSPKKVQGNFDNDIKQLQGDGEKQIPAPIAQSMIKLHSYRGSAQGVAHAATSGNRIGPEEAELVLSLTAGNITYLVNLFPFEDDIPF